MLQNQGVQNQENPEERVFEYYSVMLPEIRSVIIDEMSPDDRCRFTRCSKLSGTEARKSKFYLYGVQLFHVRDNYIMILVRFSDYKHQDPMQYGESMGLSLVFKEENQRKEMEYKTASRNGVLLWKIDLDKDTDLMQMATATFQKYLQFFQNTIKMLAVPNNINIENFDISSFNRLEELAISSHEQFLSVTSKMRRPLKSLLRYEPANDTLPENCEQLYQISDVFHAFDLKMNYQQFLNFTAKRICIHMGHITPNNVRDFITKWQNGTLRESFLSAVWEFEPTQFDVQQLFQSLGQEFNNPESFMLTIKHNSEAGRCGLLIYYSNRERKAITFDVRRQHDQQ